MEAEVNSGPETAWSGGRAVVITKRQFYNAAAVFYDVWSGPDQNEQAGGRMFFVGQINVIVTEEPVIDVLYLFAMKIPSEQGAGA